jgi:CTP:molybdopterin cytidylyltransferase MocA
MPVEMKETRSFAGLILAGGEGTRWGGPKAWAELPDGTTFLERCFEILKEAGAEPIGATLPPGSDESKIRGLLTVVLPQPGLDMFASIKVGLTRLVDFPDWDRTALLPVDHPLVTPESVTMLADSAASAAIPSFGGKHGHPVCLDRSVAEMIVSGGLIGPTLREVLRSVETTDVPVDDIGVISNCNTPEALREALDRLSS